MSRRNKIKRMGVIPKPPAVVQRQQDRLEEEKRERKHLMVYANCRSAAWLGMFPMFRAPELHGAHLADLYLDGMLNQMLVAQSQIILPGRS